MFFSLFSTRRRGRVSASVDLIRTADRASCRDGTARGDADAASFARRGHEWRHHAAALASCNPAPDWSRPGGPARGWDRCRLVGASPSLVSRRVRAGAAPGALISSSLGYAGRARRAVSRSIYANQTHTCVGLSILFRFCVLGPIRSCAIRRDHDRPIVTL